MSDRISLYFEFSVIDGRQAQAVCEVDNSVNRWKGVMLPDSQAPAR